MNTSVHTKKIYSENLANYYKSQAAAAAEGVSEVPNYIQAIKLILKGQIEIL